MPVKAFCCNVDMVSYLSSAQRHCLFDNCRLKKIHLGNGNSMFLLDFSSLSMFVGGISTLIVNWVGWGMICNPRYSTLAPSPQTPAARALISLWKELEEFEEGHSHLSVITLLDTISLRRSMKHILKHAMKAPKWRCSSYQFLMKLLSLWNRAHKACTTKCEQMPSLYIVPAGVSIYSHCIQRGRLLLLFSRQVMYNYDPTDCSMPGFPVPHHFPDFAQVHVHWVSDAIQPSHSLLPSSSSEQVQESKKIFFSPVRFHWLCLLVSRTVVSPIAEGKRKWRLKFSVLLKAVCWLESSIESGGALISQNAPLLSPGVAVNPEYYALCFSSKDISENKLNLNPATWDLVLWNFIECLRARSVVSDSLWPHGL